MFFSNLLNKKRLNLIKPDYIEKKDNCYLLIWKDIPHWIIIDYEFHQFLISCNGKQSVEDLLTNISAHCKPDKKLLLEIHNLVSLGILNDNSTEVNLDKIRKPNPILLENISLNITCKCNLRCPFCYNLENLTKSCDDELTSNEIISFLKKAKPALSKRPSLALVGGEPLEFPKKVITVSEYAIKHGFNTLVSTNGTKITNEFARQAKKIGLEVQVSIDGHSDEINDVLRGKGVFEKAKKGIQTLVKQGVYTIICMVCHSGNFAYLQDFYELADSLGVNEARFIPLKKIGGGVGYKLKPVSTEEMLKKAASIFKKKKSLRKLMGRDYFTIIANTCRVSNKRSSCGTGLQTLLLDSDGTIYPCLNTNVNALKIANIRDEGFDFLKTWKNSPVLHNIRKLTMIDNINNACSKCLVRYWCLGGCRGETYATRGTLKAKAVNCQDLRNSIIEMFWFLADNSEWIKTMTHIG